MIKRQVCDASVGPDIHSDLERGPQGHSGAHAVSTPKPWVVALKHSRVRTKTGAQMSSFAIVWIVEYLHFHGSQRTD